MTLRDQMETDLGTVFFNTNDFAQAATYTPATGSAYGIKVLFDPEYQEVKVDDNMSVQSTKPHARVQQSALLAVPAPADRVTIDGVQYRIKEAKPDGHGVMDLFLLKV